MSVRQSSLLPPLAAIAALAILLPSLARAQAPPGPIVPPSSAAAPPPAQAPPRVQRPAPPPPQPRTSIVGAWRFNRDQSTQPRDQDDANGGNNPSNNGGNGPYGGGGPYGRPGGFPFPGGNNGPFGGPGNGGNGPYGGGQREPRQPDVRPSTTLTVEQKDHEFDITDDREIRTALFTDGRKLQKSKEGDSYHEVAAKGDEKQLITDEKSPRGDKFTRTFELSPDGLQLIETVQMDNRRSNTPSTLRYVYDISH